MVSDSIGTVGTFTTACLTITIGIIATPQLANIQEMDVAEKLFGDDSLFLNLCLYRLCRLPRMDILRAEHHP